MEHHLPEDVEAVLERARTQQERPPPWKNAERSGETHDPQEQVAGYAVRPRQRKSGRKRASTFNIVLVLFSVGIGIVIYISNVIEVNQLAFDVQELQVHLDKIQNTNAGLNAEINKKSSLERIAGLAGDLLGLEFPKDPPASFSVDEDKLQDLKESREGKGDK